MTVKIKEISRKNTWPAKLRRTVTALFPVGENRCGRCNRCGACCSLPNKCPFLEFDEHHKAVCKIYTVRPLNCRKYPRTEPEHITPETCGYTFENQKV